MSFEKMVETYSRTSRTKNSDPSLFLHSKPNPVLEFCIDTNTNTSTHIKIQTHFIFFFLCFFFLKLNFHSFIQSKRTKTVQSLKKIENRGRYRRKHQTHFIYQNTMPKLKSKYTHPHI